MIEVPGQSLRSRLEKKGAPRDCCLGPMVPPLGPPLGSSSGSSS